MLETIKPEKILFLDIETVPFLPTFNELSKDLKDFWDKKSQHFRKETQSAEDVYNRAGIYAEFGKIICISFGIIHSKNNIRMLRLKSICMDDEFKLLSEFSMLLVKMNAGKDLILCGHNGKEFDFPYLSRRMLINNIKLPSILDIAGKKPWETQFLDTMELWKFGDYKNYTSLNLLSSLFNIPSPKTDIDGSQVASVYWNDHDLSRISRYCQNDVLAVVQLFLKFKGEPIISEENIEFVI
jgi:DNA polymerase elongation subunit (family B)